MKVVREDKDILELKSSGSWYWIFGALTISIALLMEVWPQVYSWGHGTSLLLLIVGLLLLTQFKTINITIDKRSKEVKIFWRSLFRVPTRSLLIADVKAINLRLFYSESVFYVLSIQLETDEVVLSNLSESISTNIAKKLSDFVNVPLNIYK